jgi:subtilisin family serine protease
MTRLLAALVLAASVLTVGAGQSTAPAGAAGLTEVVVTLGAPPLADAPRAGARVRAEQRAFRKSLARELPDARVRWRYELVANGFAVVLPSAQVPRLRELAGVREVYDPVTYEPQLDESPQQLGAPGLWGPGLDTAGQGVKIGVIDTGVDASHPFFDPSGYSMPAGFPRGQERFTNAKVLVAKSFPPPGARARGAPLAVDGENSLHGTHVAGIAAGNPRTPTGTGRAVSGIAPRAYIGNYKALVQTDSGLSPNGNAPEIVAAIEAAVRDGMDVLNLSIGEPEVEYRRDIVARALDAAAAAGVVPVVAAGNDFDELGAGSINSPGNSARAITVGAVEVPGAPSSAVHADFSSIGPTTMSQRLKPDVAAPGVGILSAVPGGWSSISGTSMASPHIAGAAALLVQRHPAWTTAQVKSALVLTGSDTRSGGDGLSDPDVQGGGLVNLGRADRPLVFADPSSLSLGLVGRGARNRGEVRLTETGSGTETWQVSRSGRESPAGARLVLPNSVEVPGRLAYDVVTTGSAAEGVLSGYVDLRRAGELRRIPYWGRVAVPSLGRNRRVLPLVRPGVYRGTTLGRPGRVIRYRYPENPRVLGVTTELRGPELVYRFRLTRRVANFGVVVTQRAGGSRVEPRVVSGLDENRLTGYAGLPIAHNPYLRDFRRPLLAAGALSPVPGEHGIVFDSATRAGAGRFAFRFWVDDVKPPTLRLRTQSVARGTPVRVSATDAGSGVYADSLIAVVDGGSVGAFFRGGVVRIPTDQLAPGSHRLTVRLSDHQEAKNTENVNRILPNTRTLTATFTVR